MPEPVAPPVPFRFLFRARLPIVADVPDPIHDGDTVTLQLDRGLDGSSTPEPLRLQRVFAPELSDPGGQDVHQACYSWLIQRARSKWPYTVETFRTSTDLHSRVTLSRYIAEVWSAQGESLNSYLIEYVRSHGYGKGIGGS